MKFGQAHRPEQPAPVPATEAQPVVKVDMETENTQPAPDIDVTVPDIPMPEQVQSAEIKDTFEAGFKFAFVGSGQGGSRIGQTFYKLGYRRVCAVNTAEQDLPTSPCRPPTSGASATAVRAKTRPRPES
jgi:hypothetical protein